MWPDEIVSESVLKARIGELRKALGDQAKAPQFIQTVHRRGYRWLVPLTDTPTAPEPVADPAPEPPPRPDPPTPRPQPLAPSSPLVGRAAEVERLQTWFRTAQSGTRQVVFVTGEAGIGKTAIVQNFLSVLADDKTVPMTTGQCVEHYGQGEAYLPMLDALGRLCRGVHGERLVPLLRQYAPSWLVQLPTLLSPEDRAALQRELMGANRERMLREIAEALEVFTAETSLVLVLEDLHWSDYSTLDLIRLLARRHETARLLLICTYRPEDAILSEHPIRTLKQDLTQRRQCTELPLEFLNAVTLGEYLTQRFPAQAPAALQRLAQAIHSQTDGHPLFMVMVTNYLELEGLLEPIAAQLAAPAELPEIALGVPEGLRQLIELQLNRLPLEHQRVLEAASVAGAEFTVAAVAAGLNQDTDMVEDVFVQLSQQEQFVQEKELTEWADGTMSGRYAFRHALYQQAVYERVTGMRRVRLHRAIGEREAAGYAERAGEIAAELAVHFERGRDFPRAITYSQQAAQTDVQRYAYREAVGHLQTGLRILETLPDIPSRAQQEFSLQTTLGSALIALNGTASAGVERAYVRARALSSHVEDTTQLLPMLWGLFASSIMRGRLAMGRELAEQLMQLAQPGHDSALLLQAHYALGMTVYRQGEFLAAQEHLEQSLALYAQQPPQTHPLAFGAADPGIGPLSFLAWTLWQLGYPDQALAKSQQALALAQDLAHPFSRAFALNFTAWLHTLRREPQQAQQHAEEALGIATEHEFAQMKALGMVLRGWAQPAGERSEQIAQGIDAWQAIGAEDGRPYFLALLAESHSETGRTQEGLALLGEALAAVHENGERYYEAELYRLKGEVLLQLQDTPEAEHCFQQALDIARQQEAKSWELRAATSLGRLWAGGRKKKRARSLLTEVYDTFSEGFDTPDLQDAKALL